MEYILATYILFFTLLLPVSFSRVPLKQALVRTRGDWMCMSCVTGVRRTTYDVQQRKYDISLSRY